MPQGAQCYNENICSARRTMAIDICYRKAAQNSPQITYLTPWGHMSITNIMPLAAQIPSNSLLAPGGNIPHLPSCPWRQHSINMRPLWGRFLHFSKLPFCPWRHKFRHNPKPGPLGSHVYNEHHAPGGTHSHKSPFCPWRQHSPYRQAVYIFSMNPGMAEFSIQRPTTTRSLVLSTKIKLVPFPTCMYAEAGAAGIIFLSVFKK